MRCARLGGRRPEGAGFFGVGVGGPESRTQSESWEIGWVIVGPGARGVSFPKGSVGPSDWLGMTGSWYSPRNV